MGFEKMSEEQLYKAYHDKVARYVSAKVSDYHDAEDLVSAVFVKVCQKLCTFDESKSSISTWIYNIAKNTVIDYYRTRKSFAEIPENFSCADSNSDFDKLFNEDMLERLYSALKSLDERSRDIIILHYYSGITLKEISEKLNMSYANMKIVHNKAINKLRELIC